MKWRRGTRSAYIEDRRGARGGRRGRTIPRLGVGGTLIALALYMVFGRDVLGVFSATTQTGWQQPQGQTRADESELVQFVSFVLDDIQATWQKNFARQNMRYQPAKLVLFTDETRSACGYSSAATGPFYCPADRQVYIDLGFYRALRNNLGAPGDFAQAYVLAHEIAHHVQTLLGVRDKLAALQHKFTANELSVLQELQADCLAGVWGHSTKQRDLLERGDIEEGLRAAAAIGDDRLQERATGRIAPEKWTHGSSKQRVQWFRKGLSQGTIAACDTFSHR